MEKNYPGKLAESEIIDIPVYDPVLPIIASVPIEELAKNSKKIDVHVIIDFTNFPPSYWDGDDWWYYDIENNAVHVMLWKVVWDKYVELGNKIKEDKLTDEEFEELKGFQTLITHYPQLAAEEAYSQYKADICRTPDAMSSDMTNQKKQYRTKSKAGDVAEIPAKMPLITNQMYINAMTYNDDNAAYLQPLKSADGLMFKDNKLFFDGLPASTARIKHLYTKDNIEDFDLPLLRVFYAIILNKFKQTWVEDRSIDETITIYYPDLAKQLGKSMNISRTDVEATINSILSFRNIMGITEKGNNILPVLVYMGEDREKNTITFASPYIVKIIKDLYKASIRKNKQGLAMKKKDGSPQMLPAYTYLPNLTLAKERNKKAVEIVCIVVPIIENAGTHGTPHVSARTIIERNQMLKQSLENTSDTSNQNKILKRAFSKAWELLVTQTDLSVKYKNIQLPIIPNSSIKDPKEKKRLEREFRTKWIPTMSNLDMVFEFPHEGKIKG